MAEGARLESVYTRKGIQGSNPCLSAIKSLIVDTHQAAAGSTIHGNRRVIQTKKITRLRFNGVMPFAYQPFSNLRLGEYLITWEGL